MKGVFFFIATIALLLVLACFRIDSEISQREKVEQDLRSTRQALKQTGDVLTEVRALRQDVSEMEASLKTLAHQRNETGERRRENIKTALAGETCATAPVPAAVADSLYQRAAAVSAGDYSGAFARKPDGKD